MDKKDIERRYLEEARRASSLFPADDPIPREQPDFLLGAIGVEVTELCQFEPRAEGARLGYVLPKARRLYEEIPGI